MNRYLFFLLLLTLNLNNKSMNISIRLAHAQEIYWINEQYDTIKFKHSDFNNEIIAIAEFNYVRCGLGRLVKIDKNIFELGGMYVLPGYRNYKIATQIIHFLLNCVEDKSTIYCIPFKQLSQFYKKFGFSEMTDMSIAPEAILTKFDWCKSAYPEEVDLLIKID